MKFELVHTIRIPCEKYFEVVLSEDFSKWVGKRLQQAERRVVRSEEIGGVLHRTVRSERELSERAQKFLKVPRLVIEERQEIERAEGRYRFEYVPNTGAKRFQARGSARVEPEGEHTRRTIQGEVTVKIPLLGGRIERRIVEWLKANITRVGDAMEEYYRSAGAPRPGRDS